MRLIATAGLVLLIAATAYSLVAVFRKRPLATDSAWWFPERIGRNTRIVIGICTALLLALSIGAATIARRAQHIRVQKEMTWECAPDRYSPRAPEAQAVRMRYVEDPHYEEVVSGRGLCDQLQTSGKKVVTVEFNAWGNSSRGLIGYRELLIDGKPVIDVGGWASSGAHDPVGPHPLSKYF